MLAFLSLVSALLVAPVVQAAPAFQVTGGSRLPGLCFIVDANYVIPGCSLAKANISALATQTVLPKPTGVLSSVSLHPVLPSIPAHSVSGAGLPWRRRAELHVLEHRKLLVRRPLLLPDFFLIPCVQVYWRSRRALRRLMLRQQARVPPNGQHGL